MVDRVRLSIFAKRLIVSLALWCAISVGVLQVAMMIALACCGHQDEAIGIDFSLLFYPISPVGLMIGAALAGIFGLAWYLATRIVHA